MLTIDFHRRYSQLVLCSHRVEVGAGLLAVRLDDEYVTHWSLDNEHDRDVPLQRATAASRRGQVLRGYFDPWTRIEQPTLPRVSLFYCAGYTYRRNLEGSEVLTWSK